MNWTNGRLLIYIAGLGASLLAMQGLADFDIVSGQFDPHPFNLYAAIGSISGAVTSALAALAVVKGWGKK
jgi:hypothetical protein